MENFSCERDKGDFILVGEEKIFESPEAYDRHVKGIKQYNDRRLKAFEELLTYECLPRELMGEVYKYFEKARMFGQPQRGKAIEEIHKAIALFPSPEKAKRFAELQIEIYTASNFAKAIFFEVVKDEAGKEMKK